ncbi:hypothetical protein Apar_0575 [Lancefieldella parvula DSM 20469]|uniref:Uncharacterized protein n=1 Tax=Lancefieldella parvula (strain ATCC 33793 / DSM 20469 / CCUG 32760 / JCM 10300 / KCTC 3663 / VPI 0546 / 1246) TaxID=521095 RepID=C8WA67_LANP1|nr:hypothetical protein [Lancefieldella parvula]ACV51005.1 hypothetical protein Apar_0575 [Lancefieldella parvula DSM 20469]
MAKKLVTVCRKGSRYDIYKALQISMAKKLDDCESGRDFAAIVKTFVQVVDEVDAMEKEKLFAVKKPSPVKRARKTYLKEVS